jgi:hypothetical protein
MILAILRSCVWVVLILVVGLGSTALVANAVVSAQDQSQRILIVRDRIGVGSHTLSGIISLASSCDEVAVVTDRISSTTYALRFKTWREPSIQSCIQQESARQFYAVVFASSYGVSFRASINGEPIRVSVIEESPIH